MRPVARGLRVAQVGLRLLDLGGLCGRQDVGELVVGLLQKPARLVDRGSIVGVVLIEQRLTFYDAVAARHVDGCDKALLGRTDFDKIRLGVALPGDGRDGLGAEQRPSADEHNRRQRRQDKNSTNQETLLAMVNA